MKQTIKIIMTVLFAVICCFVILVSVWYVFSTRDSIAYDVNSMLVPQIKDVQVEAIGDSYQGKSEQGISYYKLSILLENPGNSMKENYDLYFDYRDRAGEYFGRVLEMRDGYNTLNSGINVLPADTEGVITKVVQVDDGCKEFMIVIGGYLTKEKQSFLVKL